MKITIVDGDDWKGLYIDGKLKLQGHSLYVTDVIEALTGSRPESFEVDFDWMYEVGQLPDELSAVPRQEE